MKNKKNALILILVLVLLLGGAGFLYTKLSDNVSPTLPTEQNDPQENTENPDAEAAPAPDFTVTDMDGKEVALSDFRGKPVILNFWASWCGPCRSEMPEFDAAYQKYKDDIHFLMVNATDGSRETVEIAKDFIAGEGYTFPVYFDESGSASATYGVTGLPATFFIGAQGEAVARASGAISGDILQQGIDMILPQK